MASLRTLTFILILSGGGLAGCSSNKGEEIKHGPAVSLTPSRTEEIPRPLLAGVKLFSSDIATDALLRDHIETGIARVFSPENRMNARYVSEGGRTDLTRLNGALLAYAGRVTPAEFAQAPSVLRYRGWLEEGCRPGTQLYCKNLELFKLDSSGSRAIAKRIAEGTTDVREYYRLLRFAVVLEERVDDPELDSLLAARTIELIRAHTQKSDLKAGERDELRLHMDFIATTMLTAEKTGRTAKVDLRELLAYAMDDKLRSLLTPALAQGIVRILMTRLKEGALWEEFRASIRKNEELGTSYTGAARELNAKNPELAAMLNIETASPLTDYSEPDDLIYFFVVTRLFQLESIESVLPFWQSTKRDPGRFRVILENFVRMHFAHTTMLTNEKVAEFYRKLAKDGIDQKRLLTQSILGIRADASPLWKTFFKRIGNLKAFFASEIEQANRGSRDPRIQTSVTRLGNFFQDLSQNVKYVVTYPNLLMFAYYAKKFEYREHFDVMGVRDGFTIDSTMVIEDMLNGKVPPLFFFTDDEKDYEGISRSEMLYAVYYALRGRLPALYGIDAQDWYEKISEGYLSTTRDKLREWAKSLYELREHGSRGKAFDQICEVVATREGYFNDKNLIDAQSIFSKTLHGSIFDIPFVRQNGAESPVKQFLREIHFYSGTGEKQLYEALEIVRSDTNPRLADLKFIRSLFVKSGEPPQTIAAIDRTIAHLDELRTYIVNTIAAYEGKARDCVFALSDLENRRKREVFAMELTFQKHVHLALHALNSLRGQKQTVQELRVKNAHPIFADPFFADLEPTLTLPEAARNLLDERAGLTRAGVRIRDYAADYAAHGGLQERHDGSFVFLSRPPDLRLRLMYFLEAGYSGQVVSFRNDNPTAAYPETLRELMQQIYDHNTPEKPVAFELSDLATRSFSESESIYLRAVTRDFRAKMNQYWFFEKFMAVRFLRHWLRTAASLYKVRHQMEVDAAKLANCDSACVAKHTRAMEADARALIRLNVKAFNYLNIPDGDENFLRMFEETNFYARPSGPEFLFTDPSEADIKYFGIGDDIFNMVTSHHLGFKAAFRELRNREVDHIFMSTPGSSSSSGMLGNTDAPTQAELRTRARHFDDAEKSFETALKRQAEILLFPPDPTTLRELNARFIDLIASEMRLAGAFLRVADSEFAKLAPRPMRFELHMDPFPHPYWISPTLVGNYFKEIRVFNTKTKNRFLPEELKADPRWINGADE